MYWGRGQGVVKRDLGLAVERPSRRPSLYTVASVRSCRLSKARSLRLRNVCDNLLNADSRDGWEKRERPKRTHLVDRELC